jgi:hypothetical protein
MQGQGPNLQGTAGRDWPAGRHDRVHNSNRAQHKDASAGEKGNQRGRVEGWVANPKQARRVISDPSFIA